MNTSIPRTSNERHLSSVSEAPNRIVFMQAECERWTIRILYIRIHANRYEIGSFLRGFLFSYLQRSNNASTA